MKTTLINLVLLLAVSSASGQALKESEVPMAVRQAFAKQFSAVNGVKWSKESDTEYEAEFKTAGAEQSTNFDSAGKWLITETEVPAKSLPAAVQATLKKDFEKYKLEEAEKAETPDRGTFYEIELEQGEKSMVVQITPAGKVLKTEEAKEEGKKKD